MVLSVLKIICRKDYKIDQKHLKKMLLLININKKTKTPWGTEFIVVSIKITHKKHKN